ncbi:MAG: type II secretion system minor pseudopilin GspK [Proteobacteria bacterium]|nr:type II secretion system minor pseudopilin GspK [Pseudomonadota bacterium]
MSNRGNVLIVVLLVFTITISLLFDFIRRVYLFINITENYKISETMSVVLKSGYTYATEQLKEYLKRLDYTDKGSQTIEDRADDVLISAIITDSNSKFNVNTLVYQNGSINNRNYQIFRRLLNILKLDEAYADKLVDYIDFDNVRRTSDGEINSKNYFLFSLSELGYIFNAEDLEKIKPYLTCIGDGMINVNTAEKELLMALHNDISEELANRIIDKRTEGPFKTKGEFINVAGMNVIGINISDIITVKSSSFIVNLTASKDDFREVVEAGFELSGGQVKTRYWKEY